MKRVVLIFGIVMLLLVPLFIVLYMNWGAIQQSLFKAKFLSRGTVSPQYTAETKTPGFKIAIADTAFLEYIVATMRIYDENAIADPGIYFDNRRTTIRHTVSHLKFELVPILTRYMVALGGSDDFASRGTYRIEDDTLVVQVSLNEEELAKSNDPIKFSVEDLFLDTALQTLIFATGKPDVPLDPSSLSRLQKAIKDNIPTGLFPRPVKIETLE